MSLNLWPAVLWLVIWRCSVDLIILQFPIAGSGSGIDGKCTSPEAVAECADYYADNPDAVQQVNTGLWLVTYRHNTELRLVNKYITKLWLVLRPRSPPGSAASRRECGPAGSTEQSLSSSSSSAIYLYLFSCIICGKYIFSTTQQSFYIFYYCEAQGKGRAKGRPRKVTQKVIYRWWMVNGGYPFPDALHSSLHS